MSRRLRTAEQSAREETAKAKLALLTVVADSTAPRDPKARGDHYRRHLVDAHRSIEILQAKIKALEDERDRIKRQCEYDLSLCVGKTVAEEARRRAAAGMREKAAVLLEDPPGCPTMSSEAIRAIPDPKPKWS